MFWGSVCLLFGEWPPWGISKCDTDVRIVSLLKAAYSFLMASGSCEHARFVLLLKLRG